MTLSRPIRGISRSALWRAWREIRKDLKTLPRDVVDHVEYEIDPDVWIRRLRDGIAEGTYEPEIPGRSNLAKSIGFARTITHPSIPDAVLYRAICDHIFAKAKRKQHKQVYFQRGDQAAADLERLRALGIYQTKATTDGTLSASTASPELRSPKGVSAQRSDDAYDDESPEYGHVRAFSWFINWKLMTLARTDLIEPTAPEKWFVLTDITNFFDSVLHDHVAEALRTFSISGRMIGLLLFLLERLAVRTEYAHSAAIGLPVDLIGGSRTLAHVLLFSHDDEVTSIVGESNYLRWMDDQLFVVESRPAALSLLGQIQTSLGRLHLTPNVKKTKILTRDEVYRHFHIDINQDLDACHLLPYHSIREKRRLGQRVRQVWRSAAGYIDSGTGESGKVLSRFYLYAARSGLRFLRKRCLDDIIRDPSLAERVASYVRHVDGPSEFWRFVQTVIRHPEQVYGDVNLTVVEHLLRLEPDQTTAKEIRRFAIAVMDKPDMLIGGQYCAAVGPLLLLRFADGRSFRGLKGRVNDRLSPAILRACAIVYASQGRKHCDDLENVAGELLRNRLSLMVRLLRKIKAYEKVPDRFKRRLEARKEILTDKTYVDMRKLLTARLLCLNQNPAVQLWVKDWKLHMVNRGVSQYDVALLKRLIP